MAEMQNVWQQAELNTGDLEEVRRAASLLRDRLIATPADKPVQGPARVGLLGLLDVQSNDIREIAGILRELIEFIGERGVAPVLEAVDSRYETAGRQGHPAAGFPERLYPR